MNNEITQPTRPGAIDKTSGTPSGFPDHAFEHDGTEDNANPTLTLKSPWAFEVEEPLVFSDTNNMGTLHIIPEADRLSGHYIVDTSVTSTWETADLSIYVPEGTKAVYGYAQIGVTNSAYDRGIIVVRNYGSSETGATKHRLLYIAAELGLNSDALGTPAIILATNGKFDYSEFTLDVTSFYFNLIGYYI